MLPLSLRDALRFWRVGAGRRLKLGPVRSIGPMLPPSFSCRLRLAKRAVTSHDVLQDLQRGDLRRKAFLTTLFDRADLIASVSNFNTERLLEAFPNCRDRVVLVPNAAEDLYFEPANERERIGVRDDLGLPAGKPYLLSVANFQAQEPGPLDRGRRSFARGRFGRVGDRLDRLGFERRDAGRAEAAARLESKATVCFPGYRQGERLRAIYDEATALVFPSLCESFGIPAVEAMARMSRRARRFDRSTRNRRRSRLVFRT